MRSFLLGAALFWCGVCSGYSQWVPQTHVTQIGDNPDYLDNIQIFPLGPQEPAVESSSTWLQLSGLGPRTVLRPNPVVAPISFQVPRRVPQLTNGAPLLSGPVNYGAGKRSSSLLMGQTYSWAVSMGEINENSDKPYVMDETQVTQWDASANNPALPPASNANKNQAYVVIKDGGVSRPPQCPRS